MAINIFIDQGHNPSGINAGAEGFGLREQDITYQVGRYLADIFAADPRFEVRTSRNTPTESLGTSNTTSLRARVDMANNWPAHYFISVHVNANDNPSVNGTEAYVYRQNSDAYHMGEDIVAEIVRRVSTRNNQVRVNPSLYVLRNTHMPAVLVELAYITNENDVQYLRDDQYQFAYGIYVGMLNFLDMPQLDHLS